ncbi:Efflux pump mlcE [Trichinella spiralis]|uniref:Efflux pump mlcE n=1 Tax=Trichinella spiralis TaxID=6334 RepID=A0ABR3L123_TRISP
MRIRLFSTACLVIGISFCGRERSSSSLIRLKAGAAVLPSHQRGDRLQLLNTGVPNQTYPIDERDKSRRFSR